MSLPTALLTAGLVGVGRADLPPRESLPADLAPFHAALLERSPQDALLLLAGAAALHDAAGRLPARAGVEWSLPAFRPEGERPPCSPRAAHFLERMLSQLDVAYFPELLGLLDAAGQRAPDYLLPHLLEHGAKIPRVRPLLLPVLGERGRWLGAINPAWRYAAVELDSLPSLRAAWEADPKGRAALATAVRARDAGQARRLIESTWRNEPESVRRELLAVLQNDLSMADEPFLERALDDRDAAVRRKAAELLGVLPDSRLTARVSAAAAGILELKDGALAPVFPRRITEAMIRDGMVAAERAGQPPGARSTADWSRLLIQSIRVMPLAHWEERFGMEPAGIVAAALAGRWPRTLLTAFATAAQRQGDQRWTDALLEGDGYSERTGLLLQTLAPHDYYVRLTRHIVAEDDEAVVVFLRRWPGPWNENSARRVIDYLGRQAQIIPDRRVSPTLRFLSRQFAQRCPVALAGYAAETFSAPCANNAWQGSLNNMVNILRTRRALHEAVEDLREVE